MKTTKVRFDAFIRDYEDDYYTQIVNKSTMDADGMIEIEGTATFEKRTENLAALFVRWEKDRIRDGSMKIILGLKSGLDE